ncbi:MAG: metallophosphoesterase [bacterium]
MFFLRRRRSSVTKRLRKQSILWKLDIPMGRYAIIADNHGYFDVYKETVSEILETHYDIKGIFHLGDMFGTQASVEDCIDCLRFTLAHNIMVVRGNHCRKVLQCDTRHRYSRRVNEFDKRLNRSLKEQPDLYESLLRFPDKIETECFDLVHCCAAKPFYSNNGYSNEMYLMHNMISKPVFASHEHKFQMQARNGIGIKSIDLELDKDIEVNQPCVISVPTMNYSREKHKYLHGYLIIAIQDDYTVSIRAHHLKRSFVHTNTSHTMKQQYPDHIRIRDIVWE